ncbi:metallophosphoesterase family protein [Alkalicoccus halolimnae]|uniref:DNA repair exonuclease n=1 Tax=Alkalicoccus halolimnae TaxID=1667239 RepID=A0AAJ8LXI3_9BACI|nr:DNA repair exonuclease [Alkalicoccus halolimnae]
MVKFIHCADLHLDRPFQIPSGTSPADSRLFREAAYDSFEKICSKAVSENVDFLVISGDLYHHEERSIHAQWFVKTQMERLNEAGISVYIIHGNHDPLLVNNGRVTMPGNVFVFGTSGEKYLHEKEGESVYLYGFSYPEKAFTASPLDMYEKASGGDFHIALLHGQEGSGGDHEPYAPFQLQSLKNVGMDYWALGHIHERNELSIDPPVVYPGNIQGAHRKEEGEKGAYLVTILKDKTTDITFFPASRIIWKKINISIEQAETMDDLVKVTAALLPDEDEKVFLCTLTFEGRGDLHNYLHENREELLQIFKSEFERKDLFIDTCKYRTSPPFQKIESELTADIQSRAQMLKKENESIIERSRQLFNHTLIRRHADHFTEEDWLEIIETAESELLAAVLEEE